MDNAFMLMLLAGIVGLSYWMIHLRKEIRDANDTIGDLWGRVKKLEEKKLPRNFSCDLAADEGSLRD